MRGHPHRGFSMAQACMENIFCQPVSCLRQRRGLESRLYAESHLVIVKHRLSCKRPVLRISKILPVHCIVSYARMPILAFLSFFHGHRHLPKDRGFAATRSHKAIHFGTQYGRYDALISADLFSVLNKLQRLPASSGSQKSLPRLPGSGELCMERILRTKSIALMFG
jgi:hypothetical protein